MVVMDSGPPLSDRIGFKRHDRLHGIGILGIGSRIPGIWLFANSVIRELGCPILCFGVVRQFGPYLSWAPARLYDLVEEICSQFLNQVREDRNGPTNGVPVVPPGALLVKPAGRQLGYG